MLFQFQMAALLGDNDTEGGDGGKLWSVGDREEEGNCGGEKKEARGKTVLWNIC